MNDDISEFLPFLDNTNLTLEEKTEVLQTWQQLVEAQVDAAFGVHPVQLAGGKQPEKHLRKAKKSVDSKDYSLSQRYRQAANDDCPATQEGDKKDASGQ